MTEEDVTESTCARAKDVVRRTTFQSFLACQAPSWLGTQRGPDLTPSEPPRWGKAKRPDSICGCPAALEAGRASILWGPEDKRWVLGLPEETGPSLAGQVGIQKMKGRAVTHSQGFPRSPNGQTLQQQARNSESSHWGLLSRSSQSDGGG